MCVCVCLSVRLHAHACRGAYILSTQSGEIQFSYIFMPRRGIKYTHRSDKSWETFLAFCFGQRWRTKGARHARLSIQIGGRILPLKIFIADPFPPLFSSGPLVCAPPFFFCFVSRNGPSADRIFQRDLRDKSFRFEQNPARTWPKNETGNASPPSSPSNFKQFGPIRTFCSSG